MHTQARRFALLAAALLLLSVMLVACAAPAAPAAPAGNNTGVNVFRTPNPKAASPTPTLPPFWIGAWPSNPSPSNNEHMTIYVLCKIQPKDVSIPSQPAGGISVQVFVGPPINQNYTKTTGGNDGLAAIEFDENDPQSGVPVSVDVTAVYQGVTYHAETFFTPNPTAAPTPTPGGTPTGTPTGTPGP